MSASRMPGTISKEIAHLDGSEVKILIFSISASHQSLPAPHSSPIQLPSTKSGTTSHGRFPPVPTARLKLMLEKLSEEFNSQLLTRDH